eukprot:1883901-Rhodomonas_salina.3
MLVHTPACGRKQGQQSVSWDAEAYGNAFSMVSLMNFSQARSCDNTAHVQSLGSWVRIPRASGDSGFDRLSHGVCLCLLLVPDPAEPILASELTTSSSDPREDHGNTM